MNVLVSLLKSMIESKNIWKLIKNYRKNIWWLGAWPRAPRLGTASDSVFIIVIKCAEYFSTSQTETSSKSVWNCLSNSQVMIQPLPQREPVVIVIVLCPANIVVPPEVVSWRIVDRFCRDEMPENGWQKWVNYALWCCLLQRKGQCRLSRVK